MEPADLALIEQHLAGDATLAALWKEHCEFERQLTKLENKPFLNPEEQQERNRLKKLKLSGRDQLERILDRYRGQR